MFLLVSASMVATNPFMMHFHNLLLYWLVLVASFSEIRSQVLHNNWSSFGALVCCLYCMFALLSAAGMKHCRFDMMAKTEMNRHGRREYKKIVGTTEKSDWMNTNERMIDEFEIENWMMLRLRLWIIFRVDWLQWMHDRFGRITE